MQQGTGRLAHLSDEQRHRLLRRVRAARAGTPVERPAPVDRSGPLPLSANQQSLWLLSQWDRDDTTYNTPLSMRVRGPLDADRLAAALHTVVERHEVLRTTYEATADGPRQRVRPAAGWAPEVREELGLDPAGRDRRARRIAEEQARRPFDLGRDPVVRATLVRFAADDHLLVLGMHHIATDAWSTGLLLGEIRECYTAASAGRAPRLAELPVQYGDFAVWQQGRAARGATEDSLAYWRRELAGLGELDVPTDRPAPARPTGAGRVATALLPAELHRGLAELAEREGTRLLQVVIAGYAALLSALTGQDDIPLGTIFSGRSRAEIEPLIGFFANTAVLRVRTDGDPSFRELLARTSTVLSRAHAHQDVPFDRVVAALAPPRRPGRNPLFQFAVHANDPVQDAIRMGDVELTPVSAHAGAARFDCTLAVAERPGTAGVELSAEYATELFDADRIERLLGQLGRLLASAVADPDAPIRRLRLLTDPELRLLAGHNDTAVPVAATAIAPMFAHRAAESPEAPAVSDANGTLSYAELERRANRLAHRLRAAGAGPGTLVGVCLHRSADLPTALLAVLKSGAAYVPLDPDYPTARLSLVLDAAAPAAVLVDRRSRAALPDTGAVLVDLSEAGPPGLPETPPEHPATARDLAYVIFTSGSTGRPKGVMVEHAQVANLFAAFDRRYGRDGRGTWLAITSMSFDISVIELLWTLARGWHVVVADGRVDQWVGVTGTADGGVAPLHELIGRHRVTHLQCTPALAELLVDDDATRAALGGLTRWIVGGEALPAPLARRLRQALDGGELVNGYGPTEAAVYTTAVEVSADDARGTGTVTLGTALANVTLHVLDRYGRRQPIGVSGELFIGGAGVARGYHGRPALTAERFVPDPFGPPGARLYRTGDVVRRTHRGDLDFLGRTDHQVKVRGFRIELGEIETALRGHPGVSSAVVVAAGSPASRFLAAYLVGPDGTAGADVEELRRHCRELLPEHMVPARWQWLTEFPLTPNGKVDRAALPAPDSPAAGPRRAPRTARERELAEVWALALDMPADRIGVDDNFFAIGGHSVTVTRAVSIAAARGVSLRVRDLFTYQTIAELADAVADGGDLPDGVVAVRPAGALPPLFCLHSSTGTALPYLPLDGHLHPDRPCYAIESAPVDPDAPAPTVTQLARRAADLIRQVRPDGPYHLAGWSLGGGLAFAVALRLRELGQEVASLILLDARPPAETPVPLSAAEAVEAFVETVCHAQGRPPLPPAGSPGADPLGAALDRLVAAGLVRAGDRAAVADRARTYAWLMTAAAAWRPDVYRGPVHLLLAGERDGLDGDGADLVRGWTSWVDGPVWSAPVPGDHFSMVTPPYAAELGAALEEIMASTGAQ